MTPTTIQPPAAVSGNTSSSDLVEGEMRDIRGVFSSRQLSPNSGRLAL